MNATPPRRRWFLRRPPLIGAGLVLALAFAVIATTGGRLSDGPAGDAVPLTDFSSAYAPVHSDRVVVGTRRHRILRALGFAYEGRREVRFDASALLFRVRGKFSPPQGPRLLAACGCRFPSHALDWDPEAGEGALAFATFPRRDRELVLEVAGGDTARFPNPVPAPRPGEAAAALPVSVGIGDETWIATLDEDPRYVLVRAVDAQRRPIQWPVQGGAFRDASGNEAKRAAESPAVQHRIWLPVSGPWRLCPHEPWWELRLDVGAGRSVTFRFRPPDASALADAPTPTPSPSPSPR